MINMKIQDFFEYEGKVLHGKYASSKSIHHGPTVGEARERFLKEYLQEKLPGRIGIDRGIIISTKSDEQSKQVDLVLYDREKCPMIYNQGDAKLFPVEAVYGAIEVKSRLSKDKLEQGFNNIVSAKDRLMRGRIARNGQEHYMLGVIFAYELCDNSLDTLRDNLIELEKDVDPWLWPDLIIVNNQGLIYRSGIKDDLRRANLEQWPLMAIHFEHDTLFEAFVQINDFLTFAESEPVILRMYKELPKHVGKHYISGADRYLNENGKPVSFSSDFIDKVYQYGQEKGSLSLEEAFNSILWPVNLSYFQDEELKSRIILYNPDGLGPYPVDELHKMLIEEKKSGVEIGTGIKEGYAYPHTTLCIDGDVYWIPYYYLKKENAFYIKS